MTGAEDVVVALDAGAAGRPRQRDGRGRGQALLSEVAG
jgi:hypothetical protein